MEFLQDFVNEKNIVKDEIYNAIKDSIICPICKDLLIIPMMCMNCQNSFCKKCLENWSVINKNCPNRCRNPGYRKSLLISQLLSKIKIKCIKCNSIINYDNMKKHIQTKCETEDIGVELINFEDSSTIIGIFEKLEENSKQSYETTKRIKSKALFYNKKNILLLSIVICVGLSGVGKTSLIKT